jgi:hypothetical protein
MSTRTQDSRGLGHECVRVVDVLDNPVGDSQIGTGVLKRPAAIITDQAELIDVSIVPGIRVHINTHYAPALAAERSKLAAHANRVVALSPPSAPHVNGHPIRR